MLVVVVTLGVGLDQWSKTWADDSLGTVEHPLPIRITAAEAGQRLGDVLMDRFDLSDADLMTLEERGPAGVGQLYERSTLLPTQRAFPDGPGHPRLVYYWVFHHQTLDRPPRRLPRLEKQKDDLAEYGEADLQTYLREALPYLSDDALETVLAEYTFPVTPVTMGLSRTVKAGETYLLMHRNVSVIDGFAQLRYAENPGAAWGFLADTSEGFRKWFFLLVSLLAIAVISNLFHQLEPEQRLPAFGFAAILSGAIGNFIDRLRFNYVIDFVDMYIGNAHWPTYNVADVAISVGVALLLLEALLSRSGSFLGGKKTPPRPGMHTDSAV